MPFVETRTGLELVLTKRSSALKHHPGQIAFPGGKRDEIDTDIRATALREAHEEIGLHPAKVEVLGALPEHETVTGFTVTPVLGLVTTEFTPIVEPGEVEEAFRVPFDHVADLAKFSRQGRYLAGSNALVRNRAAWPLLHLGRHRADVARIGRKAGAMTRIQGDWINDPGAQRVCALLSDAGYQAYFVGGSCVRNDLLGVGISDLDMCTDALPARVMELAEAAGLRVLPTGIDHGTVTIVIDHEPYEITTYRKDVHTDGRRAVVAFSDRVEDDAHRRDFTMNALYADPTGQVLDPLGGLPDLNARRVRFIDDGGRTDPRGLPAHAAVLPVSCVVWR